MAIPTYEDLMLPVLGAVSDGTERPIAEVRDNVAAALGITDEERAEYLPSGKTPRFNSRVHWAKTYLEKAGVLESPARGRVRITPRGAQLLQRTLSRVDNSVLAEFEEFRAWKDRSQAKPAELATEIPEAGTVQHSPVDPEEAINTAYAELRRNIEDEILNAISQAPPSVLERVVVDLLVALGYGGVGGTGEQLGRSGDGGVDGVIWEDRLGLERIYVQAKRWQGSVGRPEVQAFSGSLDGFRARKGVFITTSTFTRDARDYVATIEKKIVLVDGEMLAQLLYQSGIGVTPERSYEVKRLDSDYFWEDL